MALALQAGSSPAAWFDLAPPSHLSWMKSSLQNSQRLLHALRYSFKARSSLLGHPGSFMPPSQAFARLIFSRV